MLETLKKIEDRDVPVQMTIEVVMQRWNNYDQANRSASSNQRQKENRTKSQWDKPPRGWVKANCDAALTKEGFGG
jgi:hypothetical protein